MLSLWYRAWVISTVPCSSSKHLPASRIKMRHKPKESFMVLGKT